METKQIALSDAELKFAGNVGAFTGYAAVFGNVDDVGDVILPGAFADSLKNRPRALRLKWNHKGPVIGKVLSAEEDGKGLRIDAELTPGHSVAQDVYASLKHGALDALSIGYRVPPGGSMRTGGVRQLKRLDLAEVSVVEDPANRLALVGEVKSAIETAESLKEIEALLRDAAGLSRADACALVSRIKSLAHGERDAETKRAAEVLALFQQSTG